MKPDKIVAWKRTRKKQPTLGPECPAKTTRSVRPPPAGVSGLLQPEPGATLPCAKSDTTWSVRPNRNVLPNTPECLA